MAKKIEYGMDVKWGAHEIDAFRIYNRMCCDQARAAFADRLAGRLPTIIPAPHLADQARAMVS